MTASKRTSSLFSKLLGADTIKKGSTHELLQGLGYIKQNQTGLIHWLPLGLRTLKNVQEIVCKRMNEAGAQEVALSALSSKALWKQTNRWCNKELFKLKDSKSKEYCLAATCEEDVTALMKDVLKSYKDLPVTIYQVTRKYRDELRPRGGLLRGREFVMKDAYSFHLDAASAIDRFHEMNKVYSSIFKDLKLDFVSAEADCGDIGGELSREFHYLHESGEDIVYTCDSCSQISNVEKCSSLPEEIGQFCGDLKVVYALNQEHDKIICFYYPADRIFNWNLASTATNFNIDVNSRNLGNPKVLELFSKRNKDAPVSSIIQVMDARINLSVKLPDFPLKQHFHNNFPKFVGNSLVDAIEGELCGACRKGHLKANNSIEIGHTFYLGFKYSVPMSATVRTANNEKTPVEMSCYGIGISRLLGAIAQSSRDKHGLSWPAAIAPYKVSLIFEENDENVNAVLRLLHYRVFIDDTPRASLGRKIKLSHQLGIPLCVIVGKKSWPRVEIEVRAKRFANTWASEFKINRTLYKWDISHESGPFEKHYCDPRYLNHVLTILLRDL